MKFLLQLMVAFVSIFMVGLLAGADKTNPIVTVGEVVELEKLVVTPDQVAFVPIDKGMLSVDSNPLFAVIVSDVKPGSPAEKAGVVPGMQIISIKHDGVLVERFTGGRMSVGKARAKLNANLLEVYQEDLARGWTEVQLELKDVRDVPDNKGKITVVFRTRIREKISSPKIIADVSR